MTAASGLLFPVGNTGEAAEKAVKLLKNPAFYGSILKEALKDAEQKFGMNKIVDQYEELYQL